MSTCHKFLISYSLTDIMSQNGENISYSCGLLQACHGYYQDVVRAIRNMYLEYRAIPASKSALCHHLPHQTVTSASVEQYWLSYMTHLPCVWQQIIDLPCPMAFGSGQLQRVTYDIYYRYLQVSSTGSDPPGL